MTPREHHCTANHCAHPFRGCWFKSSWRHIRYSDRSDFRAVFLLHEFREVVAVAYSKNKRIGRPPVFESKEELEKKIEEFFKSCEGSVLEDETGKPVLDKYGNVIKIDERPETVTGLALALGFKSRQSLIDYQGKAEFSDTITRAKLRCERYAEERLYDRDGNGGARFSLQVNFGWSDKPKEAEQEERHDDGLIKALNAAADLSPPDDVEMLPEEEDDHAEK